ncbi:hypothetical protein MHYP_G00258540 [Metynnis hypsauchen]
MISEGKAPEEATFTMKLLNAPFPDNSLNKDSSLIDIGLAVEATLDQLSFSKKISERQRLEIKMDCRKLLIILLEKLLKKAPVHHTLTSVDRGFSINKELIVENQKERSLVFQRLIVDNIRPVGGITKIEITKALLLLAAGAR